ncbi:E3 ubiquitin-ligase HECW2 [Micractinium conductrix]|uniref:E3 ubiquitin-ligase HECW2 n=1 Tax=Micractinium conductrix TaxID=554055 RepID=A0A2P6VBS4_9CHLO|nr:E3 ubiquitin-ligase HECW2 [Micractinium conductrix]PSC71539.1 E3 ubiquitin-ligase HECW2 [Micractinium conductrix]|eukprot:PSC71533.1 E3 ubiquitin-ligase HECW2 [Micractinium conductrix]
MARSMALLLALCFAWGACLPAAARPLRDSRALLATPTAGVIYNSGVLEWRSWSWGVSGLNLRDASFPMPGARSSLCMGVQPFGALSLRSPMPFGLDAGALLGFYIRASNSSAAASSAAAPAAQLGALELQFESSQPARYTITPSLTLKEIFEAQAAADPSSPPAADLLAGAAAGRWTAVKVPLAAFAPTGADGGAAFRADRLTLGLCLQRLDGCSAAATPNLEACLDKMVVVSGV